MKNLYIVSNDFLGKKFLNLRSKSMVLFILLTIVVRCSSKFSFQSKNSPRCFCHTTWWTGLSLKINVGWLVLMILREKITSLACLRGPGLEFSFHWQAQFLIFRKSLLSYFTEVLLSCTTEKERYHQQII